MISKKYYYLTTASNEEAIALFESDNNKDALNIFIKEDFLCNLISFNLYGYTKYPRGNEPLQVDLQEAYSATYDQLNRSSIIDDDVALKQIFNLVIESSKLDYESNSNLQESDDYYYICKHFDLIIKNFDSDLKNYLHKKNHYYQINPEKLDSQFYWDTIIQNWDLFKKHPYTYRLLSVLSRYKKEWRNLPEDRKNYVDIILSIREAIS